MKNQILTTAIIILNAFLLQANSTANVSNNLEPCEGAFVLNSQAEVNTFAALACTDISGSLTIETTDSINPIVDLSGLFNLESIYGSLTIKNNNELISLNGLSIKTLDNINDPFDLFRPSLIIQNNETLLDISAIQTITEVNYLTITDNPKLNNCCPVGGIVYNYIPDEGPSVSISGNGQGCEDKYSYFDLFNNNTFSPCKIITELFIDVDAIGLNATSKNPSPVIACSSSNVYPLFSTNNSLAECPLPIGVAGFTNGGGRFAAFGSSGWIQNDQINNHDNLQFFNNIMKWFVFNQGCDIPVGFTTIISKDLEGLPDISILDTFTTDLNNRCFNFITITSEIPNSIYDTHTYGSFVGEILIIDDIWSNPTLEQLNAIEDFIDGGGSLLLFGSGADYIANVGNNITNYPMNQIGKMLGITWTDGLITSDDPVVFTDFYPDAPTCSQSETNVYELCDGGNSIDFLCENLTTCYSFDGNFLDLSGNENDGVLSTLSVSIPYTIDRDSIDNKALEFTEFPQLIELPKNMLNCVYCTQSFWIKTTAENGTIISAKNEEFKNLYKIRLEDGKLGINLNSNDEAENFLYAERLVNDGDWHHIVVIIDKVDNTGNPFPEGSKEIKIYVDETSILPLSVVNVGIDQFIIPENTIYLGNAHRITDGIVVEDDQFIGSIDDLQFYDKALTLNEIKSIEDCKTIGPLESDCIGDCGGDATPGTTCDDGAPNTLDDVYDDDCNCIGVVDPCFIVNDLEEGVCYLSTLNELEANCNETKGDNRNVYACQFCCIANSACEDFLENGENGWGSGFAAYVFQANESRGDGPLYDENTFIDWWVFDIETVCDAIEVVATPQIGKEMANYLCFAIDGVADHYITELLPIFLSYCSNCTAIDFEEWDNEHDQFLEEGLIPCFFSDKVVISEGLGCTTGLTTKFLGILLREVVQYICQFSDSPFNTELFYDITISYIDDFLAGNFCCVSDDILSTFGFDFISNCEDFEVTKVGGTIIDVVGDWLSYGFIPKANSSVINSVDPTITYFTDLNPNFYEINNNALTITGSPSPFANFSPIYNIFSMEIENGDTTVTLLKQIIITDNDADADLIGDTFETNIGLDPNSPNTNLTDQDNDGLNDFLEAVIGSNPLDNDTDDDGFNDYVEFTNTKDFNNPDNFPEMPDTPSCDDGVLNGDEEDIDCGGSCTNICMVGVDQIQAIKDFSIEAIIPMPVYQHFDLLISSNRAELVSVEIYNSVGQILYRQNNQLKPQLNELRIDVNDLPSGIHLLSVKSNKSIITDKIIKY